MSEHSNTTTTKDRCTLTSATVKSKYPEASELFHSENISERECGSRVLLRCLPRMHFICISRTLSSGCSKAGAHWMISKWCSGLALCHTTFIKAIAATIHQTNGLGLSVLHNR